MSKYLLIVTFLLFGNLNIWSQASLPFSYSGGNPGTAVLGLSQSGLGIDYVSSPKMKFAMAGSYLILNFSGTPGTLSFKMEWLQASTAARFPGNFTLEESADGVTYTIVQVYNATNGTALTNKAIVTETFTGLLPTTRYLKWSYPTRTNGNIAIGDINLIAGSILSITPKMLDGFTYISGKGPSPEQNFTVGGTNFTHDITLTPPADYEISLGTGSLFQPANVITLSPSGGLVANTTIYTRLKSGLASSNYNENISVSSIDASTQTVACDGIVTPVPTLALTDISDLTLNSVVGKTNSQTINVSAVNLNYDLGLSLIGTDANQFSLSRYSVPLVGSSIPNTIITVTYLPTSAGNHTATLMLSSDNAMSVSRKLNGFAEVNTGVDTVKLPLTVSTHDGNIIFNSSEGEILQIYNSIGQKILQKLTIEGKNVIPVSLHGVLLVKIGNQISKVIL
jgi:hypothetical protein